MMAEDSDSDNSQTNRRSIADRLNFFENQAKIQVETSQQQRRRVTDDAPEKTCDTVSIATSQSDDADEFVNDKKSNIKSDEDDDDVFKTENENIDQNRMDGDEKEDNQTKGKKWNDEHIEHEKEEKVEDQFEKSDEQKQEEDDKSQQEENSEKSDNEELQPSDSEDKDKIKDQFEKSDEWKQEEEIDESQQEENSETSDNEELQPSDSEDKEKLSSIPEDGDQNKTSDGSEQSVDKVNQYENDGDDDEDEDDDEYDDASAVVADDDQHNFYDAVAEPPVETSDKETDLWKTHSDEEHDRKMWECTGEPDGSEMSRSEQKALWETTDDNCILINENEDVKPEDVSVEIESKDETASDSKHETGFNVESESHNRASTHESCDYTIYENYENSLISSESRDVYRERWNSRSSDEEDKFKIQLTPVVTQTNVTTNSQLSDSNSKVQTPGQTNDECTNVDSAQAEDILDVSMEPNSIKDEENKSSELLEENKSPELLEENKSPELLEENKSPELLEENKSPELLEENKSPELLEENKSPELLEENIVKAGIDGETHKPLEEVSPIHEEIDQESSKPSEKIEESGTDIPVLMKDNNKVIEGTVYQNVPPHPPPIPTRKPSKPTELKHPIDKTIYQNAKPPPIPDKSYRSGMSMSNQRSMVNEPPPIPDKSYRSGMSMSKQTSMMDGPPRIPEKSYRGSMSMSNQTGMTDKTSGVTAKSSPVSMLSAENTNKPKPGTLKSGEQDKPPLVAPKPKKESLPMTKQPFELSKNDLQKEIVNPPLTVGSEPKQDGSNVKTEIITAAGENAPRHSDYSSFSMEQQQQQQHQQQYPQQQQYQQHPYPQQQQHHHQQQQQHQNPYQYPYNFQPLHPQYQHQQPPGFVDQNQMKCPDYPYGTNPHWLGYNQFMPFPPRMVGPGPYYAQFNQEFCSQPPPPPYPGTTPPQQPKGDQHAQGRIKAETTKQETSSSTRKKSSSNREAKSGDGTERQSGKTKVPPVAKKPPPKKSEKAKKQPNGLICVRGLSKKTSRETLCDYLDAVSDVDRSGVVYSEDSDSAVVQFTEPIDFDKVLKRIGRKLEGCSLEVCEVEQPKCVVISCDKRMPSDSNLINYFETKRSGGGPVVKCEEKDGMHLIHFEDCKAVDRVCEGTRNHKIDGEKLTISPVYVTEFGNFWNQSKHKVIIPEGFEVTSIDPYIKQFIKASNEVIAEINETLHQKHAKLSIIETLKIECLLSQKTPNIRQIVKSWKTEVQEIWAKFLEDTTQKIEICVTEEVWPDLMIHVENIEEKDESKIIVIVERDELKLIFVGYRNVVETLTEKVKQHKAEVEQKLDRKNRRETKTEMHRPAKVRLLQSIGALDDLNSTIADDFECTFDTDSGEIQCTGVEEDIVKAKLKIFELLSEFHTSVFDFEDLSENQVKLLCGNIVQDMISQELQSGNKQAEFEVSKDNITLYVIDQAEMLSVKQIIQDMVMEDTIKLDKFSRNVLQKQVWADTKQRLENANKGKLLIEVKGNTIHITATSDIVNDVMKKLKDVITQNTILKETILVPDVGKMKFITKHCNDKFEDLQDELEEESVHICVQDNNIEISGTKAGLLKVRKLMEDVLSDIHHRQHDINKHSVGKVIAPENTAIFSQIEDDTTTIIIQNYIPPSSGAGANVGRQESVDDIDLENLNETEFERDGWKHRTGKFSLEQMHQQQKQAGPQTMPTIPTVSQATPSVPLQKGQVQCQNGTIIYLVKGELAKQQVDVIVCSTSKDLNLKAGKAGTNILQDGGTSIQDELKKDYPQGIQHGDVAVSSGGNLKCKKIYFGSLQDWRHEKGKPVKTITTFMTNCLNKAHQSSFISISFAALGTGALGYPRDEAAELMYQSAMDFDKANPNSTLKTIKFIVYPKDGLTVDAFEQEEMSHINPAMKKAIKKGPVISKHGIRISIEKGSLGEQKADVLVCATPKDLSLSSALASKSLLKHGGESIQAECSQKYPNGVKDGEIAEVGGGELKCQMLYLTSVPGWDTEKSKPEKETVVYKVISSCLDKASKAKYKSLAIPAIGTGKVNYPRKTVAELLYNCVLKFSDKNPKSSIQSVTFVVFPKDMETVRAFEKEEHNRLNPQIKYSSGSNSVLTSKCNIKISIDTSSLSSAKVDVIVCSTAPGLDLNAGQSSKALLEAGGKTLQDDCENNYGGGIDCGEIAVVGPGKLSCKKVYFGCLPKHSTDPKVAEKTLADFMMKCLEDAESDKMKSIAFPSLGTGGNGYPHDVAARIMYQAVFDFDKQHSSTSIKQVNFVIYSKDHKSIQAFQTEEKQHQTTQSPSSSVSSFRKMLGGILGRTSVQNPDQTLHRVSDQDFAVGNMMLTFSVGDLLVQKVDAIVNSTNTDLDLSRGGISLALKKKCGQSISDECSKKVDKMRQKKIVTTTGCGLPCKKIIHIDSKDSLKGWKKMMILCLNKAEKHQFTSIAFPVLGTGGNITNFTPENIAELFYESVLEHSKAGDNQHLKAVKVLALKPDMSAKMVSAVQNYKPRGIMKKCTDELGNLGLIPKPGVDSDVRSRRNQNMNSVSLMIFSDSDDNIDKAIDMLDDLVNKEIKHQTIRDTLIPELKDSEIQLIKAVGKKFQIKLEIDVQSSEIHVEGVQSDLVDAKDEIHKLLSLYQLERHIDTEAKIIAESVQWYCKEVTSTGLNLDPYPPRLNLRFEDSLKKQLKSVEFKDPQDIAYILDLEKMKEYPKNDPSDECDVVRKEILKGETVELPAHWTDLKDQSGTVQLINVVSSSGEYKNLEQKFLNSVLNGKFKDRFSKASLKVKKIERVQNKALYQQFEIKKKQLENQTPQGIQLERDLWHGTAAAAIDSINYYGFNRSYCGGAGHGDCWYGDGVYFSGDGSYSARAWLSQGHGTGAANIAVGGAQTGFTGQVYLAKVLTGECVLGTKGMRYLPQKPTGNIYDCAVDNVQNPVEFIIFNDTQAYPDYIITFDT